MGLKGGSSEYPFGYRLLIYKNMAQRRMFSLKIVDTDEFLDMPPTTQNLYFHFGMRADDDGFVSSPKKIMKIINSAEDDLKLLFAKKFIIPFDSGVCVVKHWKIHNYIQKDRYEETQYIEEKSILKEDSKGIYLLNKGNNQECIQNVSKMETQVRLGKDRLGKDKKELADKSAGSLLNELIDLFNFNPSYTRFFKNKTQREALATLLKAKGEQKVREIIKKAIEIRGQEFAPKIDTPLQLLDKWLKVEEFKMSAGSTKYY